MRQLIAAGGGNAENSRPLDDMLVRLLPAECPLLYLPIAMNPDRRSYKSCLDWMRSVFSPLGLHNIVMWTDVVNKTDADLRPYAGIYIGGGNTFKLLHNLKSTGFISVLRRFIERGGIVYGGSAGAIILGRDIMTAAHLDANEVGLQDTTGLDLLDGYAVWCHYQPADDARIHAYIARSAFPVIALSEQAGLLVEDGRVTALGTGPTFVFQVRARHEYEPSSIIFLLDQCMD
jgi:dipeptidase E